MNFDLSDEQLALQETVQRFCESRFPMSAVRRWGQRGGFDLDVWRELAGLGVFQLATLDGSAPRGLIDAVLAYEILGRYLAPGPIVGAPLGAALVEGAGEGRLIASLVNLEDTVMLAHDLDVAEVVVAVGKDHVSVLPAGDLVASRLDDPLDPTSSVWLVEHVPEGHEVGGADLVRRFRLAVDLLVSALLVGISEGSTGLAAAYARERRQFGRPIGSFQAVKHMLADSFVRTEVAQSAVYAAAVTADDADTGDVRRAVSGARYLASNAALSNAKTGVQVFGGMGFTWDVDAHLYVKRAWALGSLMGSTNLCLDSLAGCL